MDLVYTLPAVIGLGALHSLEPGHGKGVITAYLISSGAKIKDAVLIGLISAFQLRQRFLQTGGIIYICRLQRRVNLLEQAAENLARSGLDIKFRTCGLERLHAIDPADRACYLAYERIFCVVRAVYRATRNVGCDGGTRIVEREGSEHARYFLLRRLHQTAMERCAHGEQNGATSVPGFA